MATVACPGCGLPRAEDEIGEKPCTLCAAIPTPAGGMPSARKKLATDPTAGLPADVSELNAPAARPSGRTPGGSRWLVGAAAFALGTLCGVGGLLGYQAIEQARRAGGEAEIAAKAEDELKPTGGSRPPLARIEVAPMPHEPKPEVLAFGPEPDDGEQEVRQISAPPLGHVGTHEFNDATIPHSVSPLRNGQHVVLRGKVKTLRVHSLASGATLDASKLDAAFIVVSGNIDGRSTLKLNTTSGVIQISAAIDRQSTVEITGGGEVKFMLPTTPTRPGSKIDNGSTVSIAARVVEFKGDITGNDTRVSITLARSALLKIASITGKATVEYRSQAAGWSPPEVTVGFVSPTATFRKID